MSKKRQFISMAAIFVAICYILLAFYLPANWVEENEAYSYMFFIKIAFVALSAATILSAVVFSIIHRSFVTPYYLNFIRFKSLLWQLVKRDFITKYKRSVLGVLWSLLSPMLTMLVMTLVFSTLFSRNIPNFPVYLLSGQVIFGFYNEATTAAMGAVIGGGSIIKKVYVPKYIFPVSKVFSGLVNFAFSFLAFLIVFVVTGAPFHGTFFLLFIPVLYILIFSLGIGMLLSCMAVFFRDITYLYSVFMVALTYFTPLFYPVSILPEPVLQMMGFNPLYHFVEYFRSLTLYGTIPGVWENMVCLSLSLFSLLLGGVVFMSKQDKYILHL